VDQELAFATALEQADLLRGRAVSPTELVELYLERIDRLNPSLGAYITVASDFARQRAKEAERELAAGEHSPPFLGVPISIKDLNNTAGIRTTYATAAWKDRVPDYDDDTVARIKRAGFVIIGKTITPEFGLPNISEPPAYPPGRNPWNPELSCGGSSGGAASAIAAGLCPISQGSDGGGSIRNPSAWCGTVGLKPSRGRVSHAPQPNAIFSINGPLARTVADAAALLDVMSGYTNGDAFWAPPPDRPFADEAGVDPGRLRVAFHPHPGVEADACAPACAAAARDTAKLLEELGHHVEEATPPVIDAELLTRVSLAFAVNFAAGSRSPDALPPIETMAPWFQTMYLVGNSVSGIDYVAAMDAVYAESRRVIEWFEDYDVLVTPTVAQPPPPVGLLGPDTDFMAEVPRLFALTPFTAMWNNTGQPAISLPVAMDGDGLPVGVQIVGRPAAEATLVRVGAQVEAARPWRDRRPPIS
jgi:amidase